VRFAARALSRRPSFVAITVLTLALGIGANAAIFSVVDAALLKPLPYADPDRLVSVWPDGAMMPGIFVQIRDEAKMLAPIAGYSSGIAVSMTGASEPARLVQSDVTSRFFDVLGVKAEIGRTLLDGEDLPGRDHLAVLGHALWQQRFGGDSAVVGKVAWRRRLQGHWGFFREQGTSHLINRARHRLKGVLGRGKQPFGETTSRFGAADQEDTLDQVSAHAAATYFPQPYDGRLVLYRATDQLFFRVDSLDLGWGQFATGAFETYDVPGDHWSILKGKSASMMARHLQSCLGTILLWLLSL
jgi:hypothetical protein